MAQKLFRPCKWKAFRSTLLRRNPPAGKSQDACSLSSSLSRHFHFRCRTTVESAGDGSVKGPALSRFRWSWIVAACEEDPVAREGEADAAVHVPPDHLDLGADLPGPAALVSRSVLPWRGTGAGGSPSCGPSFRSRTSRFELP